MKRKQTKFVHSDAEAGQVVHTPNNRMMVSLDVAVKKTLEKLHSEHFANAKEILSDQFLYRKTHYGYLKAALAKGIELDAALNFHDEKIEPEIRGMHEPKTGGQRPRNILHISSSEDRSAEILSHGAYVDKGIYVDGAFVISINVRKPEHIPDDFQPSAYMTGHLIKHDRQALAYEPTIAKIGRQETGSEAKVIANGAARRDRLIEEYRKAGFHADTANGMPYRICNIGGEVRKTYLPLIVHDTANAEYYVVEDKKRVPLEEWFGKMGMDSDPRVRKDMEALRLHRQEKSYFDEYIELTSRRKKAECTDSREHCLQNSTRSSIRIIGAILSADERRRVLETPGLEYFTDGLHFGCGYLTTAMKLHEAGWEIRRIFEKGERSGRQADVKAAREFFKSGINSVFDGNWRAFSLNDLLAELKDLNGGEPVLRSTISLLNELLKSQNADLRMIAQHMKERNILAWSDELGTLVVPAAVEIDKRIGEKSRLLPHNRQTEEQQKAYYDAITVQVTKDVEEAWIASFNKVGRTDVKAVRVVIKSYNDGVSYMVDEHGDLVDPFSGEKAVSV